MSELSRRAFLRNGPLGLAVAGGVLTLPSGMGPTAASGDETEALQVVADQPPAVRRPTEDNILGPFHRPGAPYRAKVTPPLEPGKVLVISGRVWGHDTRKPLAGAVLDIWQANAQGRYDNDDPKNPPAKGVYKNRTRVITDPGGYYEFETIHPGQYQIGANQWRPSHIHYLAQHAGYKQLVTQLYFRGDPYNKTDRFIKPSLIIDLEDVKVSGGRFQTGRFDIVLAKA